MLFFTDETLAQLVLIPYLIIMFCNRDSKWERQMLGQRKKWPRQNFGPLYIGQSRYGVLKQKKRFHRKYANTFLRNSTDFFQNIVKILKSKIAKILVQ